MLFKVALHAVVMILYVLSLNRKTIVPNAIGHISSLSYTGKLILIQFSSDVGVAKYYQSCGLINSYKIAFIEGSSYG